MGITECRFARVPFYSLIQDFTSIIMLILSRLYFYRAKTRFYSREIFLRFLVSRKWKYAEDSFGIYFACDLGRMISSHKQINDRIFCVNLIAIGAAPCDISAYLNRCVARILGIGLRKHRSDAFSRFVVGIRFRSAESIQRTHRECRRFFFLSLSLRLSVAIYCSFSFSHNPLMRPAAQRRSPLNYGLCRSRRPRK